MGQMLASAFKTGSPPAWVESVAAGAHLGVTPVQETGGQVFTLIDTQINAVQSENFVKDISTDAGVRSGANLEFVWDPSYQVLTIHRITIERETQPMDRLEPSKFKVIQQETDLNRQIYNGTLSAVLFLEDVRVGDRIEFAYTLRGANPSFNGLYSDSFSIGSALPIAHRRIRLLWPEKRRLHFQAHGATIEPESHTQGGVKEYIWDLRDVPAVGVEDQMPSWFQAYPWIQLSEFSGWSDVADWASKLYITTNLDSAGVEGESCWFTAIGRHPGWNLAERFGIHAK